MARIGRTEKTGSLDPVFEKFELGSQLRKAAYSVPANILIVGWLAV